MYVCMYVCVGSQVGDLTSPDRIPIQHCNDLCSKTAAPTASQIPSTQLTTGPTSEPSRSLRCFVRLLFSRPSKTSSSTYNSVSSARCLCALSRAGIDCRCCGLGVSGVSIAVDNKGHVSSHTSSYDNKRATWAGCHRASDEWDRTWVAIYQSIIAQYYGGLYRTWSASTIHPLEPHVPPPPPLRAYTALQSPTHCTW